MTYSAIALDQIPAPDVVEALDFETILAEMRADLVARAPELAAVLALESEPLNKLLEVCAYRELILRARVNDAARAVMLATATGSDLDHLAALLGVARLEVTPADPTASPPQPAIYEDDAALRLRAQLSLEGLSTAGPRGSYEFHARSASAEIADVAVDSPTPGTVRVTVLARSGDGTADQPLLDRVNAALTDERVRPLCDTVQVQSATITPYQIDAQLTVAPGPDAGVVRARALDAVTAYTAAARRIGQPVTLSGLYAALHREGVARVALTSPAVEVAPGQTGVAHCTQITVTVAQ
ncbi:MAG: baseplate J/gp47 family protein [Paracoccus sp. (in: a-proteobacteria)]|uniref:baseplate assembly protein n=1 Tax=Paracoccus sp. TaxID=267 RepID=UPI0026E0C551|nr:baseplate J/gp47 family protein [Paracoccus sp. (in: a-proteobacteria)]MDO5631139.1 baseplate J/gp47 family protein [Paracoccus sp. (in: a-proteobacteria)]